jgi:hypothetical protein
MDDAAVEAAKKETTRLCDLAVDVINDGLTATSLKKVLKSLRTEKARLAAELENTADEQEREEIASRLRVISVQRKKGLNPLKELKKQRKTANI